MCTRFILAAFTVLGACTVHTRAELITVFDFDEWQSIVVDFTTIDFTGFPDGTPISDQYTDLGVTFTGPTFIFGPTLGFPNDGWGLHGPVGLHLTFNESLSWIAVDHGGVAMFELYHQGKLVGISEVDPVGGIGSFVGVFSTVLFDEIIITKPVMFGTHIGIDDLHFGAMIPASGALGVFAFWLLWRSPRGRRREG